MLIAKVEGTSVLELGTPQALFPNTSFTEQGPDEEFLTDAGCMRVNNTLPYDPATHRLAEIEPYIDGDVVRQVQVIPLTEEELNNRTESLWANIRATRNSKLRQSDWTQMPDVPIAEGQKSLWCVYRQALRDITTQPIENIVWPTPPDSETV